MGKMQKVKKGFTLVELSIVIAVIAILIAVLVPTFISLINSAQESSDKQLVKNINTALSVEENINGESTTMSEALAVAAENGYNVDKLTPSSSGDIVWDQVSNRFLLINSDGEVVYKDDTTSSDVVNSKYQLWYIAQSASDVAKNTYSYYINYTTTAVEAVYGVDVGANSDVDVTITGTTADATIIVNTNGGKLTVNAAQYDVSSYGTAKSVTITAVSMTSFHVYSEVTGTITIAEGHLDIKSSAVVTNVYVDNADDTKVQVTNSSSNQIEISADKNEVATKVAEGVSNATALQVDQTTKNLFDGGIGTEASPFQIATAQQFVNIGDIADEMLEGKSYYFKLTDDISLQNLSISTFKSSSSKYYVSEYIRGELDGAKEDGTSYKIYTNDSLSYLFAKFGNVVISNIDYYLTGENTVYFLNNGSDDDSAGAWYCDYATFDNLDYYTTKTGKYYDIGHNDSLYFSYNIDYRPTYVKTDASLPYRDGYAWTGVWTVKNCDVSINLRGQAGSNHAVFFGAYIYDHDDGTSVTIDNCTYSGTFLGGYVALAISNGQGDTSILTINNLVNYGSLLGVNSARLVAAQNYDENYASYNATGSNKLSKSDAAAWYDAQGTNEGTILKLTAPGLAVGTNDSGKIVITRETGEQKADTYEIEIYGSRRIYNTLYGASATSGQDNSFSTDSSVNYNHASNYNYALRFTITLTDDDKDATSIITQYSTGILVDYDTATRSNEEGTVNPGYGLTIPEGTTWYTNEADSNCEYCIITVSTETSTQVYYVLRFTSATENNYYRMNVTNPTLTVAAYKNGSLFGYDDTKS